MCHVRSRPRIFSYSSAKDLATREEKRDLSSGVGSMVSYIPKTGMALEIAIAMATPLPHCHLSTPKVKYCPSVQVAGQMRWPRASNREPWELWPTQLWQKSLKMVKVLLSSHPHLKGKSLELPTRYWAQELSKVRGRWSGIHDSHHDEMYPATPTQLERGGNLPKVAATSPSAGSLILWLVSSLVSPLTPGHPRPENQILIDSFLFLSR